MSEKREPEITIQFNASLGRGEQATAMFHVYQGEDKTHALERFRTAKACFDERIIENNIQTEKERVMAEEFQKGLSLIKK